jgi:bifunctional UDP-N-acetylglucosamine pyrophosphorylase/glucosamine-1-phosphate N-acetyltransferase
MREVASVILAAGKGTRMKSQKAKVVMQILKKPMVRYVVDACIGAGVKRNIVVVGHQAREVTKAAGEDCEFVVQKEQLGTAHALMQARELLKGYAGDVVVLVGDAPLITSKIIGGLIRHHQKTGADATLITAYFENPPPYGRILRDKNGKVIKITEELDADESVKAIKEVNSSHYCFKAEVVLPLLSEIKNDNVKKEYYLTDIVEILNKHGYKVETYQVDDPRLILGINTYDEFLTCQQIMDLLK